MFKVYLIKFTKYLISLFQKKRVNIKSKQHIEFIPEIYFLPHIELVYPVKLNNSYIFDYIPESTLGKLSKKHQMKFHLMATCRAYQRGDT